MTNPNTRDIGVNLVVNGLNNWLNSINSVNSSLASVSKQAHSTANAIGNAGNSSFDGATSSLISFTGVADDAAQAVYKIDKAFEQTEQQGKTTAKEAVLGAKELTTLGKIAEGAWETVGGKIADVIMSSVIKLKDFIAGAPALAGEFQQAILRFGAASGILDPKALEEYKNAFLQLGEQLPISTLEAVKAAEELAKGGVTGNAEFIKKMVAEVSKFSLASEMSLTDSAAAYVKIMGTYTTATMPVEDRLAFVSTAMDNLTKSAGTSTVGVRDLLDGMLDIGGVTQSIGLSFEDTAMGLGAVAPSFGSTAEAATSFYNMLYRLIPQTNEATDAFYQYGLMTDNYNTIAKAMIQDGLKPQGETVDELKAQYASFLKEVKGLKSSEIDKMFVNMADNAFYADGKLKPLNEIAGILQKSFSGLNNQQRIQALTTIFQTEAMNTAVSLMRSGTSGINDYEKAMQSALGVSDMFNATFQGSAAASTNLEGSVESLRLKIGGYLEPAHIKLIDTQNAFILSTGAVISAIMSEEGAYTRLTENQRLVADGFFLMEQKLTVWGYMFTSWVTPITSLFDDFAIIVQQGLVKSEDYINSFVGAFEYVFGSGPTSIGGLLFQTSDIVMEILTELFKLIIFIWEASSDHVANYWEDWGDVITNIVKFIYDTVVTTFLAMFSIIADVVNLISAIIRGDWTAAFEYGQEIVDVFVTWFTTTLLNLGSTIIVILLGLVENIGEWVIDMTAGIAILAVNWYKWLYSFMPDFVQQFTGGLLVIDMAQIVHDLASGWKKGFKQFFKDAISEVNAFARAIIDTLGDIFNFGSPSKTMMKLGKWTAQGYAIGIENSISDVAKSSSKMASAVISPISNITTNTSYYNDNTYNLGVTTTASQTQVIRSYDLMKGFA